ncbi:MAG: hypothetical protein ACI3ZT_00820 [Candidatus Cryptobacteroides sp.]
MEMTISQIRMKADIIKAYKTIDELVPGDFLYLVCSGLKNDGGIRDAMYWIDYYYRTKDEVIIRPTLCEVEKVIFTTDKKMMAEDFVPGPGGTRIYDVPEGYDPFKDSTSKYRNHAVQLVTLVYAEDTGRYFFIDRQGYNYNRYVYVRPNTVRKMFKPEIRRERRRRDMYEEQARQQHLNACRREGILAEKRLDRDFPYLNQHKSLKWNLTAIFRHYGVEVQVKQWSKSRYYDHPFFDINYFREQDRALISEIICVLEGRWNKWECLQYAKDLSPKGYCWHESRTGNSYDSHIFHNCFEERFGSWQRLQIGFLIKETEAE